MGLADPGLGLDVYAFAAVFSFLAATNTSRAAAKQESRVPTYLARQSEQTGFSNLNENVILHSQLGAERLEHFAMGYRVANVELVRDYTTQRGAVRFHIDLPMPADHLEAFGKMMDTGEYDEAFDLVKQTTKPDNLELVSAFRSAFMAIKKLNKKGP